MHLARCSYAVISMGTITTTTAVVKCYQPNLGGPWATCSLAYCDAGVNQQPTRRLLLPECTTVDANFNCGAFSNTDNGGTYAQCTLTGLTENHKYQVTGTALKSGGRKSQTSNPPTEFATQTNNS